MEAEKNVQLEVGLDEEQRPNRVRQRRISSPIVTYALLAVIFIIYAAMLYVGHGQVDRVALQFGDKENPLIWQGQWWRLITAIFLHGSLVHVSVNGLSLYWLGNQMERLYGARRYFLLFLFSGICGNLFSFLLQPAPSLGASGALFGLVGAGLVFPLRYPKLLSAKARKTILSQLVAITVLNLAISFAPGIDLWAHVGGLCGGGFLALFLMPSLLDNRPKSLIRERSLTFLTVVGCGLCLVAAALQWRVAMHERVPEALITYATDSQDPWWSFQAPATWKPHPSADRTTFVLVGPEGARFYLSNLIGISQMKALPMLWPNALPAHNVTVAGKPAWYATILHGAYQQDICLIRPYPKTFLRCVLVAPTKSYGKAHKTFLQVLQTFHFFHPPRTSNERKSPLP